MPAPRTIPGLGFCAATRSDRLRAPLTAPRLQAVALNRRRAELSFCPINLGTTQLALGVVVGPVTSGAGLGSAPDPDEAEGEAALV